MDGLIDAMATYIPIWLSRIGMYITISLTSALLVYFNYEKLKRWAVTLYSSRRDYVVSQAYRMFIEFKPKQVMQLQVGGTFLMFILAMVLTWPYTLFGVPMGAALTMLILNGPKIVLDSMVSKRVKLFTVQLIDALTLMANALRSGLNVPQAVQLVSDEMPNPIAQEFGLVLREQKVGVPMEEAFTNMSNRLPSDDIDIFVTSVNILRETGGNLAETFDTITHTIRERVKLEQKISAMVAQGVVQGTIMVMLPFGLAIMMYTINPNQTKLMFTTPLGWGILCFMMTLQGIGAFAIWKIINIKV